MELIKSYAELNKLNPNIAFEPRDFTEFETKLFNWQINLDT